MEDAIKAHDEIIFSFITVGSRSCRLENKSATLSHCADYSVSEIERTITVNQSGKCIYCGKGAYMGGRFY